MNSPATPPAVPDPRRRLLLVLPAAVLIFLWQYTIISNTGILRQPWNATYSGFSVVRPSRTVATVLGFTASVARFPVCTLVDHTMDYPEGSGSSMVALRHMVFDLGLVPPDESRLNGVPLALINTLAWVLMLFLTLSLVKALRTGLSRSRA